MSNKIFIAINSYKSIKNMNIGWYELLMKNLSKETIIAVEKNDISLDRLSDVIKLTMEEVDNVTEIESTFLRNMNQSL